MKRLIAAAMLLLGLSGCASQPAAYTNDFFAMDTFMSVTLYGSTPDGRPADDGTLSDMAESISRTVNRLDAALSRTQTAGDLYRLNHADGAVTEVSAETYEAVRQAVAYAEQTGGAFDPTMAPVTDLWQIGTDQARVPAQAELDEALTHVGYQNVKLLGENRIQLLNGAQIDLGGIGKGFAGDAVCALLQGETGAASWQALAALGGNIVLYGGNPARKDGSWVIGVADPDQTADSLVTLARADGSVVTSGDYERFFEQDGKRYHHIFDPATGYPADTGLRSVTVIDESSTRADAMTTALFVMGLEKGMAFCREQGIAAVFITADKQVVCSPAVSDMAVFSFEGEDKGYTYAQ